MKYHERSIPSPAGSLDYHQTSFGCTTAASRNTEAAKQPSPETIDRPPPTLDLPWDVDSFELKMNAETLFSRAAPSPWMLSSQVVVERLLRHLVPQWRQEGNGRGAILCKENLCSTFVDHCDTGVQTCHLSAKICHFHLEIGHSRESCRSVKK